MTAGMTAAQEARAQRIAADDAALDLAMDRLAGRADPDWRHWMGEYSRVALEELELWVRWHLRRAERRTRQTQDLGLGMLSLKNSTDALDGVLAAASDVFTSIEVGAQPSDLDLLLERLHRSISSAKAADQDCAVADFSIAEIADQNHEEIEVSYLRSWVRALCNIVHCWGEASSDPEYSATWLVRAANGLIVDGVPRAEVVAP